MDDYGLRKGFMYWPTQRMREHVVDFMVKVKLPSHLMTEKYFVMMALLLFPTILNKTESDSRHLPELNNYLASIRSSCFDIFKENNICKRQAFF